ncbi:MAG: hypothetical protein IJV46_06990 [Acidaminococcaceae bacterium]|nr:hypothetical protein [Acidaminococcaceae bacterium]
MGKGAEHRIISGKQPKTRTPTEKTEKASEKNAETGVAADNLTRRQKSEIRRLQKIYKDLPESQKILVSKLIARAAYINSKLEETESLLDGEGIIVDFENGSQVIQRLNPYLKAYMDLLKIYSTLMEQIEDMIRHDRDHAKKESRGKDADPLEAFINAR